MNSVFDILLEMSAHFYLSIADNTRFFALNPQRVDSARTHCVLRRGTKRTMIGSRELADVIDSKR
jgi:hypothetical protein